MTAEKHDHGGFLETALGRAGQADAKNRPPVEVAPTITYTEELESGRTFAISPQIKAILGYSQEDWMGDANLWRDCIHPEDRDRVLEASERATQASGPYSIEYRFIAQDGRIVWVHDEAVLIGGSQGQPLCWQGVLTVIAPN